MTKDEFNKIPDDYVKSTIKSAIEMIEHIDTNTFGVLLDTWHNKLPKYLSHREYIGRDFYFKDRILRHGLITGIYMDGYEVRANYRELDILGTTLGNVSIAEVIFPEEFPEK